MPFLNGRPTELAPAERQMSSYANTPVCIFVQERLPEMPVRFPVFPGVRIVHQLESLILAQNERWRHA